MSTCPLLIPSRPITVQSWGSSFDDLADHVWSMLREMQRHSFHCPPAGSGWTPSVNLYETSDRFLACVELAGMPREQIDVRAVDDTLHVRGVRRKPSLPEPSGEVSVHLMEIDSGPFHRAIPLPADVLCDGITAHYRLGYLWIVLPRRKTQASI